MSLGVLVSRVIQAPKDQLEHQASKALPVTLAELELPGQLGHQGPLDLPARKEKLVPKVRLEIQGAQDHKVHKETAVCLDYRDCKDPWDKQDLVALRAKKARKERGETMARLVRKGLLASKGHRGA